ncbi:amidohydrolase family protein [Desulfobacter curvatus]|uniref:amidohydrolase family protein n=1 Tax=Desulfobacter curvatus TaxID=2290 RepID=UPI00037F92AB|nr:amidohydrolase family protein [Desulfobacter curvatus]
MKIINAHVHMIELAQMVEKMGDFEIPSGISVLKDIEATLPLLDIQTLLAQMDRGGVSKSLIYAVDAPIVYASNEYVHSLCSRYPDRLMGIASVDPFAENALEVIEHAVKNLGLKGLKFHPPLQNFFVNDEKVFPIYEKALELNIPVIFHVGTTPFGSLCRLSQANPLLVDDIAFEFPDLRIMLTHLGTLWHNESFMVVEKNPNVFIDTAAYLYEIPQLLTMDLIRRIGEDKIIFGTDYPMPYSDQVHQMVDFVRCIKKLKIPKKIRKKIFSKNIEKLLYGAPNTVSPISVSNMLDKTVGNL